MADTDDARMQLLNDRPVRQGQYVLYWMQAAQRAEYNQALEYAIQQANHLGQPLLAVFGLTPGFPEANERHYRFMLEGLRETQQALEQRGIRLLVRKGEPPEAALEVGRRASLIVADRGYLRLQKQWREQVAQRAQCRVVQVETEVVVPLEQASEKEEAGAYTLRPKLTRLLERWLQPVRKQRLRHPNPDLEAAPTHQVDLQSQDMHSLLRRLPALPIYGSASRFTGGTSEALRLLRQFIRGKLGEYHEAGRDPALDATSHLSPYLHFGQISPMQIALMIGEHSGDGPERFLEQLIVRRELAMNFTHFDAYYDSYDCVSGWQAQTLGQHAPDERPVLYTLPQLETAETGDDYWNAAMREMLVTGFMHNRMRMYWGKKIIEWSPSPREAFDRILYLNNQYFVDGRDPVSFANVAWCFGKHDRPFAERVIFGKVRYMNAAGLKRHFDMDGYLRRIAQL